MLKNHLKIIVMNKLKDKSMSGYDLIKDIHNSTGSWKPSFGSMYPLLKELHEKKLVNVKNMDRKKIYSLTAKGNKVLAEALGASKNIMDVMIREFKVMECMCTPKERRHMQSMVDEIRNNRVPFGNLTSEIHELQDLMMELHSNRKVETREKDIKAILNDTIIKLKKI